MLGILGTVNYSKKNLLPTAISCLHISTAATSLRLCCRKRKHDYFSSIKRTSLSRLFQKTIRASMTVEAGLVLPLFLFFFLNLLSAIEIIRLHSNLQLALWNAGREACIYGSLQEIESLSESFGTGLALAEGALIKTSLCNMLGRDYLNSSPLENGTSSIFCMVIPHEEEPNLLEIRVVSKVAALFPLPAFQSFSITNVYYGHFYCGYEGTSKEMTQTYYVTTSGEVYHLRESCSYLHVKTQKYMRDELSEGKYKECQKCRGDSLLPWVFVTSGGECFHTSLDCPALKRTIYTVTDTTGYRPCSRCATIGESN